MDDEYGQFVDSLEEEPQVTYYSTETGMQEDKISWTCGESFTDRTLSQHFSQHDAATAVEGSSAEVGFIFRVCRPAVGIF